MSPSDPREPRLPSRAEALLEGWPAPSRGALDWEESASVIMNRVRHTAPGSTPDELLNAPLPEEPHENAPRPNPVSDAPRAEASLAEIARAALAASDTASKAVARDGLIAAELGRKNPARDVTPSPQAVASASVAELQGRVAPPPPPVRRAEAEPRAPMTAVAMDPGSPPVVEAAARSVHPAALSEERRRGVIPAIFGGSVLALAAAAALYISFERHAARQAPLSAATEQHIVPVAHAPSEPTPPAPVATASAAPARSAIAMNDLEQAAPQAADEASTTPAQKKGLAFHVKKETAPGAGKLVLEEHDEASNAAPASAPPVAQAAPAPAQAGALAERPSTGAIQGAFGAVLTSARSCLAGQEEGTRAIVTFDGPTGRVKSVVLEGPGAGTPAEPCVRSALMGARLSPFSEPSYTASVTVRPL